MFNRLMFDRVMFARPLRLLVVLTLTLLASVSGAQSSVTTDADKADPSAQAVQKLFAERFDNPLVTAVRSTPYGLYEV